MGKDLGDQHHNSESRQEEDYFDSLLYLTAANEFRSSSGELPLESSKDRQTDKWRISGGLLSLSGTGDFFYDDPAPAQESPILGEFHEAARGNNGDRDYEAFPPFSLSSQIPQTSSVMSSRTVTTSGPLSHGNDQAANFPGSKPSERGGRREDAVGEKGDTDVPPRLYATRSTHTSKSTESDPFNDKHTPPMTSLFPKIQVAPKSPLCSDTKSNSSFKSAFSARSQSRLNDKAPSLPKSSTNDMELSENSRKYTHNSGAVSTSSSYYESENSAPIPFLPAQSQRHFDCVPGAATAGRIVGSEKPSIEVSSRSLPSFNAITPYPGSEKPSIASSLTESAQPEISQDYAGYDVPTSRGPRGKYRFKSYQLEGKFEQPWREDPRMNRTRYNNWIVWSLILVGVAVSAYICFSATKTISKHEYCLILEDNFKTLDRNVWSHEVQIDGFGNSCFDWTTTDPKNSYVDVDGLHIVPTLTNQTTNLNNDLLYNGGKLNLTKAGGDGSCTGTQLSSCAIASNSTLGRMIPPVRSARLTTKGKKSIRYGRVEVVAKMPRGDWIWPAIWMFPETSKYGDWPRSGEIDIMESRGNDANYSPGGRDVYASTLHWGPSSASDAFWKTTAGKVLRRTDFTNEFHTFGVEWSEDYIYTYLDSRLVQVLFVGFKGKSLWDLGGFARQEENATLLQNPWGTKSLNAPFDQNFYLILNVAVGGTNGWFPDGVAQKPWLNSGVSTQWDFYRNADDWLPTWGAGDKRGMTVKSVKMWQQGACL